MEEKIKSLVLFIAGAVVLVTGISLQLGDSVIVFGSLLTACGAGWLISDFIHK